MRPYVGIVLGTLRVVRSGEADDEDSETRLDTYCLALGDLPAWAVAEACTLALRGKVGVTGGRFAPTPGELHLAAEQRLVGVVEERAQILRVLGAKIVQPLSEAEMVERGAKIRAIADDCIASLEANGSAFDPPRRRKSLRDVTPAEAEANLARLRADPQPMPKLSDAALRAAGVMPRQEL